jgi:hypothetical protein
VAANAEALGDEPLLLCPCMHEDHVGVSAPGRVEGLARALGHHLHLDPRPDCEQGQDMAEEAAVLRRGGGGEHDGALAGGGGAREGGESEEREQGRAT